MYSSTRTLSIIIHSKNRLRTAGDKMKLFYWFQMIHQFSCQKVLGHQTAWVSLHIQLVLPPFKTFLWLLLFTQEDFPESSLSLSVHLCTLWWMSIVALISPFPLTLIHIVSSFLHLFLIFLDLQCPEKPSKWLSFSLMISYRMTWLSLHTISSRT